MQLEKVSDISVSFAENLDIPDVARIVSSLLIVSSIFALVTEANSGEFNLQFTSIWLFAALYGILLDMLPRSEKEHLNIENDEILTPNEFYELTSWH